MPLSRKALPGDGVVWGPAAKWPGRGRHETRVRGVSATGDAAQNSKRPAMAAGRSSELSLSSFRDYTSSVPSLVATSQVPMRKYPQCSNLEKSNWEADAFLSFTKSASI